MNKYVVEDLSYGPFSFALAKKGADGSNKAVAFFIDKNEADSICETLNAVNNHPANCSNHLCCVESL